MPGLATSPGKQTQAGQDPLYAGGFYSDEHLSPLNQENITEDVSHAWFAGKDASQHPYHGQTSPYATGSEDLSYSWAKAPRYNGKPAETGPLSEMVIASNPLFNDFLQLDGPSAFLRELARLVRAANIIPAIEYSIKNAMKTSGKYYRDHGKLANQLGHGLIEAPRGALGHWVNIKDEKISSYQIITPTAWNASPRDAGGVRGPLEEALIGMQVENPTNPLGIHHVVRSFDPCLVCTVHTIDLR
jgi:hydrogenase large subunit